jgi:tRNA A37 threonylcarbamoyladenosine synthetase subunit TsaC/SUA5/YrdC
MIIVSEDISKAAEILNEENLVAIPTETVYGRNFIAKKR